MDLIYYKIVIVRNYKEIKHERILGNNITFNNSGYEINTDDLFLVFCV